MEYRYPDGNEVVFVMFLFNVDVDLTGKISEDGETLLFQDMNKESLQLKFIELDNIELAQINIVQKPVFEDLKNRKHGLLRT
jgi:hypothetical protein